MDSPNAAGVATADQPINFSRLESKYRLVMDQFITPEECRQLIELTDKYGVVGDGYAGNPHPHTPHETFGGYSFDVNKGRPETTDHKIGLAVIQRVRRQLMRHFHAPFLWLDYAQIVFREATGTGTEAETEEYSHPWHFDNQSSGVKHRTHTAIMYLNDGFEGGYTQFREADFGPFREVKPSAGKLVAFRVAENAHAVSKLKSGRRYVLNMWFSTRLKKMPKHRKIFSHL
jgi:hypothetical protein